MKSKVGCCKLSMLPDRGGLAGQFSGGVDSLSWRPKWYVLLEWLPRRVRWRCIDHLQRLQLFSFGRMRSAQPIRLASVGIASLSGMLRAQPSRGSRYTTLVFPVFLPFSPRYVLAVAGHASRRGNSKIFRRELVGGGGNPDLSFRLFRRWHRAGEKRLAKPLKAGSAGQEVPPPLTQKAPKPGSERDNGGQTSACACSYWRGSREMDSLRQSQGEQGHDDC
ncbi:hypothetical protein B0J18DRAFT_191916 [Chaetomium sp. MPI-SDFR-AT-0129]|nr:hypothetical protein B0J18DRAFT_191916 [Chaetomium sp. MPI-SDFR-AT-0129]